MNQYNFKQNPWRAHSARLEGRSCFETAHFMRLLSTNVLGLLTFFLCGMLFAAPIKTIHFATEATYPPFEFVDNTGQIKGFDIDIANALCQKIKAACTFNTQSFNSLIPSLKLGKYDALIATINITKEREQQVAFTHPYYEPSASFVAPIAKHETIATLSGRTIGVQSGTTFEKYLKDKYGSKVTIKTYSNIQEAFLDLSSGRVDLVFTDTPIALTWLRQNDNTTTYGFIDNPIIDPTFFGTGYGIAVRKDDTALLNALNEALAAIKQDGTYKKIVMEYFGP